VTDKHVLEIWTGIKNKLSGRRIGRFKFQMISMLESVMGNEIREGFGTELFRRNL